MCFCATANFAGSAVLGVVGVATLLEVRHRRELLFAALPSLYALHQFTEGFVWLGLTHVLPAWVGQYAGTAFALYAQGLLPFILPLSVLLMEPTRPRRRRMLAFVILGGALTLYILWSLIAAPLQIYIQHDTIVYNNPFTSSLVVGLLYIVVTSGALFFSGYRYLIVLGILNTLSLLLVMAVNLYAFTSLWCAYAAAFSIIIYFFFRGSRSKRPANYALP
jgi:hypothetical protein